MQLSRMVSEYLIFAAIFVTLATAGDSGFCSDRDTRALYAPANATCCTWQKGQADGPRCLLKTIQQKAAFSGFCKAYTDSNNPPGLLTAGF
jgi:hypothetical protein